MEDMHHNIVKRQQQKLTQKKHEPIRCTLQGKHAVCVFYLSEIFYSFE